MGRHKQFVPEDVVDCVMDVFWNNGYAATSPRALADAAGIGVSSLYNAFGSKHDLFLRVLRRYAANELAHQIRLLDEPGPVRERIRRLLEAVAGRECPHRRGWLAVNTAVELGGRDESVACLVHAMFEVLEHALCQAIEEGRRSGELTAGGDPAATAAVVLATVSGLGVLAGMDSWPERVDAVIRTTVANL